MTLHMCLHQTDLIASLLFGLRLPTNEQYLLERSSRRVQIRWQTELETGPERGPAHNSQKSGRNK